MRILGIDPGIAIVGFGLIEADRGQARLLNYGAITTPAGLPLARRLVQIEQDMDELIAQLKPDAIAVEELFFSNNIPTNIISITDGQIFLESSLFFSGHRPAVNVGLSVSRVGGAAQTKAMKKAVGTLRLDLAQYREMEVFTQFSSDLDEETKSQLAYGQSLMYILRQGRSAPLSQAQQIVTLVTAMAHIYQQVPVAQVCQLRDFLLGEFAVSRQTLMLQLEQGAALTDELRGQINDFAKTALEKFKRTGGR